MNANQIRQAFLDFFASKQHQLVPSAPMVIKNDPTLMFTNAGMNQFKDIFLGHNTALHPRVANSQKCLRVSGKHNDLEEVGKDTYHHTMFEMLGNWSFGDYFKKEAIDWAWEFLHTTLAIDKDRMYVTVFGGDKSDGIEADNEAFNYWKNLVSEDRILYGSKKDNFWEMGDSGPCGPCSEIHVDIRPNEDREKISGKELVNKDHPQVIEIWNLVFIQFNRTVAGDLIPLASKHVDTGMGFERLCMVMQKKQSNYDTDVFQPLIQNVCQMAGIQYGKNLEQDIAVRVISDHVRAISFAICDGQLPSNTGAGYVIRRILRRAVRYGYTFLKFDAPFINKIIPVLVGQMGNHFPELVRQQELITKVIQEEELSFLKTLAVGIQKFEHYLSNNSSNKTVNGLFAFELFDTFGFPIDLTQLMATEKGFNVDMEGFKKGLEEQKNRSRQAASIETSDWVEVNSSSDEPKFVGYDTNSCEAILLKYRQIKSKDKTRYQLVFSQSPFYAESGGQVGDKGLVKGLTSGFTVEIDDTKKENNLSIHIIDKLPENLNEQFLLTVDSRNRILTENNHSATHLLHSALRIVLGTHVEQKGSLVNSERLRFDFSHFSKMTDEEISKVEKIVNLKISQNIPISEHRDMPMDEAVKMGAMALFGEKYGNEVRVISFDPSFSTELCGGTHVKATGQIGLFKIISEGAIAAGVRRIEAITSENALNYLNSKAETLKQVEQLLKNPKDIEKSISSLLEENSKLQKQVEVFNHEKAMQHEGKLIETAKLIKDIKFIAAQIDMSSNDIKNLAFSIKSKAENGFLLIASNFEGKPSLSLMISENLVEQYKLDASSLIREFAKEINGGGGGQKFFATAGGKNPDGLKIALQKAQLFVEGL